MCIRDRTQDEAREAILKQYNWNMKVKYQDKEASVNNILVEKVNNILEEIYAGDMQEANAYETDQHLMEAAKAEAALIAGPWHMAAKNGGYTVSIAGVTGTITAEMLTCLNKLSDFNNAYLTICAFGDAVHTLSLSLIHI